MNHRRTPPTGKFHAWNDTQRLRFYFNLALDNNERLLYNKSMKSPCCQLQAKRFGKDRKGTQRFRCNACGKTFAAPVVKPLGSMHLPVERGLQRWNFCSKVVR
jgi:ribosomal protein L37AE/L43A